MDFCLLIKIWAEILVEIELKTQGLNIVKKLLITLSNMPQMHLKLLQKSMEKTAESAGDLMAIKLVITLKS